MISKELLSEVLGFREDGYVYYVDTIFGISNASFKHYSKHENYSKFWQADKDSYITVIIKSNNDSEGRYYTFNIYELAHKCKEKAREYGYSITTGNRVDGTGKYDVLCIHKDEDIECSKAIFFNETVDNEPTGCFVAMKWILDNKETK